MFYQVLSPAGNLWFTVVLALVPLIVLLFLLAVLRITAWLASILAGIITLLLGIMVWHAPLGDTLKSYFYGGLTGFWVIDWITFWGLVIFNTLVLTGEFASFKRWMVHHATADIRIQTIMLAWAFGALLEGLVGFGYPWAVVVPILVGLGIADLDAIRVSAMAKCARFLRRARSAHPGLSCRNEVAVAGAFSVHRKHRRGSRAAPALDPDLSRDRLGRDVEAWPLAIVGRFPTS